MASVIYGIAMVFAGIGILAATIKYVQKYFIPLTYYDISSAWRFTAMEMNEYIKELLKSAKGLIISRYGKDLVSIAVFGSVARGDFNSESDIDMIIVVNSDESMGKRLNNFGAVFEELFKTDAYRSCKEKMMPHKIQPIILTPDEVRKRPSILLDLVTDGRVIFDKDDFLRIEIEALQGRLKEIGAKKIEHAGKWYWILKPGIKRGEVVEV